MIYLDYSANTPVDARVLEQFCAVERRCIGNANSHHQAGSAAKAEIDAATIKIASLLGVQPAEIIYTSGASEANNFALKGLARLSRHAGRHIISTPLEHSSVSGTLTALQEQGYEIDLLDVKQADSERHRALTGRENAQTLRTAAWLEAHGKPFWLRYVLVPGISDAEADIRALGERLGGYKSVERVELLPYHTLGVHKYEAMGLEYKLRDVRENTPEQLDRAAALLREYFPTVVVN